MFYFFLLGKDFFENIRKFYLQHKIVILFFILFFSFFHLVDFSLTLISELEVDLANKILLSAA